MALKYGYKGVSEAISITASEQTSKKESKKPINTASATPESLFAPDEQTEQNCIPSQGWAVFRRIPDSKLYY